MATKKEKEKKYQLSINAHEKYMIENWLTKLKGAREPAETRLLEKVKKVRVAK